MLRSLSRCPTPSPQGPATTRSGITVHAALCQLHQRVCSVLMMDGAIHDAHSCYCCVLLLHLHVVARTPFHSSGRCLPPSTPLRIAPWPIQHGSSCVSPRITAPGSDDFQKQGSGFPTRRRQRLMSATAALDPLFRDDIPLIHQQPTPAVRHAGRPFRQGHEPCPDGAPGLALGPATLNDA